MRTRYLLSCLSIALLTGCGQVSLFDGNYSVDGSTITLTGKQLDRIDKVEVAEYSRAAVKTKKREMDIASQTPDKLTVAAKDKEGFNEDAPITLIAYIGDVSITVNIALNIIAKEKVLVTRCASGYSKVGSEQTGYFCIHTSMQSAKVWIGAQTHCSNEGTKLATFGQYYTACKHLKFSNGYNWIDDMSDFNNGMLAGGAGCYSLYQAPTYSISVKYGFRCAYVPQPTLEYE